jgi:hypothetical protein
MRSGGKTMKILYLPLIVSVFFSLKCKTTIDYDNPDQYDERVRNWGPNVTVIYEEKSEEKIFPHFDRIPPSANLRYTHLGFFGYADFYPKCLKGDIKEFRYYGGWYMDRPVCSEKPFYALTQKDVQEKAQESKK